jgi:hypothetical protein
MCAQTGRTVGEVEQGRVDSEWLDEYVLVTRVAWMV